MKSTVPTPEFLRALGQAVLDFGFMENTLRTLVLVVSRSREAAAALVPPGNAVSQNLDLLDRICQVRIDPRSYKDWSDLIEDLRCLYVERNRIFHGMFFVDEGSLILAKSKKGKRGNRDHFSQVAFDPISLEVTLNRLNARRRQIYDFIDDYASSDEGPSHSTSQEFFPSLRIRNDA